MDQLLGSPLRFRFGHGRSIAKSRQPAGSGCSLEQYSILKYYFYGSGFKVCLGFSVRLLECAGVAAVVCYSRVYIV